MIDVRDRLRLHRRPTRTGSRRASRGQGLVEFALVFPLFLVLTMGTIEFAFVMHGQLSVNYATREAALIAGEAGNDVGADCVILQRIQQDITAPANTANITEIQIYWTNASGQPLDTGGNVTTAGDPNEALNLYVPGSTTCNYPDGTSLTVPYSLQGTANYPESARCNAILGTLSGCLAGHNGLDTIGVKVSYADAWRTPLHTMIGLLGPGWSITQSNEMRAEPVL